ncbi:MAG: ABC transporter ATP-binding protein [Planctomycetota bacterium]|nr:ABC transporter ATP-binding protein [Planctomycetota bacterium]
MLEARSISFAHARNRPVLDAVSHVFEPGQVTAILGPNGAGKTTLLRVLLGTLSPSSGEVLLGGTPVSSLSPVQRAARIAYVPQRADVLFPYTLREMLAMGVWAQGAAQQSAECIERALSDVSLLDAADRPFSSLSAGQQQRAVVARASLQLGAGDLRGSVLLADEPVAAMDPRCAQSTMQHFQRLASRGAAVVVVLHDLQLAAACASHILMLSAAGRVESCGLIESAMTSATLAMLYGTEFSCVTSASGSRSFIAEIKPPARAERLV